MNADKKVRYAVVGLGYIAQTAVLPAFQNAESNSVLTALVSGDEKKLKLLGEKYQVDKLYLYSEFEILLRNKEVDAIYIATPNFHHRNIMETAALYGVHVLCEMPMAVTTEDCLSMIQTAEQHHVKLMIAYRLHFEASNLRAITQSHHKMIGELKIFNSVFCIKVKDKKNIRLKDPSEGGGPLYDIGVYCINASRYLFQSEPIEVFAMAASDQEISVIMKFPHGRLANFSVSLSTYPTAEYDLIGTKGRIRLENSYNYDSVMKLKLFIDNKVTTLNYPKRDQFSPELLYFSECILKNRRPEPSGVEGLADVKIIEALLLSLQLNSPVLVDPEKKRVRPSEQQKITCHAISPPESIL